jgi:hypothetical protein
LKEENQQSWSLKGIEEGRAARKVLINMWLLSRKIFEKCVFRKKKKGGK